MPSFGPRVHEEADTRIFACAVDTDVVVLVIPMAQQL